MFRFTTMAFSVKEIVFHRVYRETIFPLAVRKTFAQVSGALRKICIWYPLLIEKIAIELLPNS